jgi:2'-5' RNA ligase
LPEIVRLFFGIRFPLEDESNRAIAELLGDVKSLGPELRPVRNDAMHVTLKFLGDTRDELVDDLAAGMGEVASTVGSFSMQLRGLGVFPNERRPSVLWLGLLDAEPLKQLAHGLDSMASEFGFEPERREYRPHLTIARIKGGPSKRFFEFLGTQQDSEFGRFRVDHIELIRSKLLPTGAAYSIVASADLSNSNAGY